MNISDEAVEAAVEAHCEGTMRAVLEAAAPHMPRLSRRQGPRAVGGLIKAVRANGWDEGYAAGVREEQPGWTKNPHRSQP